MTIPPDKPIITIIRVSPNKGSKASTLAWFHSIATTASHYQGFLTSEVFETVNPTGQEEVLNIFSFDTYGHLMAWLDSAGRKDELEKGKRYFTVDQRLQLTGLEFWFDKALSGKAPRKWKMLLLTIATIFILLNTLAPVCRRLFRLLSLPEIAISLLSVSIMVTLMTYYIMPAITKIFSAWLSPASSPPRTSP